MSPLRAELSPMAKTLKPALALLRQKGMRLIAYMDDILVLAESKELITDHLTGMVYLLETLGFIIKSKEICFKPHTRDRVSRYHRRLPSHGASTPGHKNKANSSGGSENSKGRDNIGPLISSPTRHDECNQQCHSPSPSFLSSATDDIIQCLGKAPPVLRNTGESDARLHRGVRVVEPQHVQLEWQGSSKERSGPDHRLRCIHGGLGSILQSADYRGLVVNTGTHETYQLPQTASSHSSSPIICKDKGRYLDPPENRQHNSSGLHQLLGRNSVQLSLTRDLWTWCLE